MLYRYHKYCTTFLVLQFQQNRVATEKHLDTTKYTNHIFKERSKALTRIKSRPASDLPRPSNTKQHKKNKSKHRCSEISEKYPKQKRHDSSRKHRLCSGKKENFGGKYALCGIDHSRNIEMEMKLLGFDQPNPNPNEIALNNKGMKVYQKCQYQ